MKHINELNGIIEMAEICNLPKEIIIFENKQEAAETDNYFKNLVPSGVTASIRPNSEPELPIDRLCYGGYVFHIIKTNYNPNE